MSKFSNSDSRIALLIDADNAPASKIDFIISELATYGRVNIRRAYGNWKKPALSSWEKVLHEYAIKPIQTFDIIKGKNASDMALLGPVGSHISNQGPFDHRTYGFKKLSDLFAAIDCFEVRQIQRETQRLTQVRLKVEVAK